VDASDRRSAGNAVSGRGNEKGPANQVMKDVKNWEPSTVRAVALGPTRQGERGTDEAERFNAIPTAGEDRADGGTVRM